MIPFYTKNNYIYNHVKKRILTNLPIKHYYYENKYFCGH